MPEIELVTTFLEQREQPVLTAHAPSRRRHAILRAEQLPTHFYLYLYDVIGRDHHWVDKKNLTHKALEEIIHAPSTHILVLYVDGAPAGFAELSAEAPQDIEILLFGLAPEYRGGGLGRYFFSHVVEWAWSLGADRVLISTNTLDHPAALPLYQKLGFSVYAQERSQFTIPEA